MTENLCNLLDGFLDGLLDAASADQFVEHLPMCRECRESVRFDQELTIAAQAADRQIVLPKTLVDRTQRSIRHWQRRRRLQWMACVAALLFVGSLIVVQIPRQHQPLEVPGMVIEANQSPVPAVNAPPPLGSKRERQPPVAVSRLRPATVRIRSQERPRHIAVSRPTENDNVTFVMLLPTIAGPASQENDISPTRPNDTQLPKGTYQ
jgi:hypothetical protein